jgi:hypothetical protein
MMQSTLLVGADAVPPPPAKATPPKPPPKTPEQLKAEADKRALDRAKRTFPQLCARMCVDYGFTMFVRDTTATYTKPILVIFVDDKTTYHNSSANRKKIQNLLMDAASDKDTDWKVRAEVKEALKDWSCMVVTESRAVQMGWPETVTHQAQDGAMLALMTCDYRIITSWTDNKVPAQNVLLSGITATEEANKMPAQAIHDKMKLREAQAEAAAKEQKPEPAKTEALAAGLPKSPEPEKKNGKEVAKKTEKPATPPKKELGDEERRPLEPTKRKRMLTA